MLDADWLHTELLVAGITRREFHIEIRDAAPAAPERFAKVGRMAEGW